ncbi:hypothetical protein EUX98_g5722 [Antrodiella citrinella]|uniref:Uncharacterized protein n=1 Tax=Antrodiella citrinella TaxID=2447956 RepID=A0A4S4MQS2_9APHY|nr:hypothetical protein EUX98_g5722 [Antrodiella citrinella]
MFFSAVFKLALIAPFAYVAYAAPTPTIGQRDDGLGLGGIVPPLPTSVDGIPLDPLQGWNLDQDGLPDVALPADGVAPRDLDLSTVLGVVVADAKKPLAVVGTGVGASTSLLKKDVETITDVGAVVKDTNNVVAAVGTKTWAKTDLLNRDLDVAVGVGAVVADTGDLVAVVDSETVVKSDLVNRQVVDGLVETVDELLNGLLDGSRV